MIIKITGDVFKDCKIYQAESNWLECRRRMQQACKELNDSSINFKELDVRYKRLKQCILDVRKAEEELRRVSK